MRRCAVIIGVNQTGGLPTLNAAASGAKQFDHWARSQGMDTRLLVDDAAPVRVQQVEQAVQDLLNANRYEQMIVFFAGHGFLKAADSELWLLSGAPTNAYEAVNVPLSVSHARNAPLRHVVFISDACRAVPPSLQWAGVLGHGVFPNVPPPPHRAKVDLLFATAPGDPAYEAPLNDAVNSYRGIYTDVLIDGLTGKDSTVPEQHSGKWLVCTRGVDPYLAREVPGAAGRVNLLLRQTPETRAESYPPMYLAELAHWSPPAGVAVAPPPPPPAGAAPLSKQLTQYDDFPPPGYLGSGDMRLTHALDDLLNARGRESFETGFGFTIVGSDVPGARAMHGRAEVFRENDAMQIRLHGDRPTSVMIGLDGGGATMLAAWPGYIGTVLVRNGVVANVNYTPARNNWRYGEYEAHARQLEPRRAMIAARVLHGRFRLDPAHALQDADYLRQGKAFDPTLGIYAAYAYAQVGAAEQVRSVLNYMADDLQDPPFDVVLLAKQLSAGVMDRIVPACPMLTQGWMLLEQDDWQRLPEPVRDAGRHLRPALWTTFTPEGTDRLHALFA